MQSIIDRCVIIFLVLWFRISRGRGGSGSCYYEFQNYFNQLKPLGIFVDPRWILMYIRQRMTRDFSRLSNGLPVISLSANSSCQKTNPFKSKNFRYQMIYTVRSISSKREREREGGELCVQIYNECTMYEKK